MSASPRSCSRPRSPRARATGARAASRPRASPRARRSRSSTSPSNARSSARSSSTSANSTSCTPERTSSSWARPVVVHSASPCSLVVQKVQGWGGDLDSEPFALALGDVDGVELAALDLVQHGLAGAAQHPGGVFERQVVGRNVGDEARADLVGQADAPGGAGGDLLAVEQSVAQPAADRPGRDVELLRSLVDGDEIVAVVLAGGGGGAGAVSRGLDAGSRPRRGRGGRGAVPGRGGGALPDA